MSLLRRRRLSPRAAYALGKRRFVESVVRLAGEEYRAKAERDFDRAWFTPITPDNDENAPAQPEG